MKRLALALAIAAAGCGDKAVDALTELKQEACACQTYDCLTRVEAELDRRAAEWKDPSRPSRAKHVAEELVGCLASSRARIDEETRREVEQKLHGVDSQP